MYINSAKDSKMRTTRELIEYLRRTADDIEMMLEDGEIESELELEPAISLYWLQSPYLVTCDGFISLNHPGKMTDGYGI